MPAPPCCCLPPQAGEAALPQGPVDRTNKKSASSPPERQSLQSPPISTVPAPLPQRLPRSRETSEEPHGTGAPASAIRPAEVKFSCLAHPSLGIEPTAHMGPDQGWTQRPFGRAESLSYPPCGKDSAVNLGC